MKLGIDGKEYDIVTHKGSQILFLLELQQQTREFYPPAGIGARALYDIEKTAKAAKSAMVDGPPDDAFLWMAIVVFLSRRAAGESITFKDAISCTPDFIPEEGDIPDSEDETQDPTEPDAFPETSESDTALVE